MTAAKPGLQLSTTFEAAVLFSIRKHEGQYRKGNRAPYVSHPMVVAALVLECGGTETQAIAALLHDTIEDCGVTKRELEELFGNEVAEIVDQCTEKLNREEHEWKSRKKNYLEQLKTVSTDALLIIVCDKYHNLLSLKKDLDFRGEKAWSIFKEPRDEVAWYYRELKKVFLNRSDFSKDRSSSLRDEFIRLVEEVTSRC